MAILAGNPPATVLRRLDAVRLDQLAKRGGKEGKQPPVETYRAGPEAAVFKLPGTLEGALAAPGTTHRARFHLDSPTDVAIEIETPGGGGWGSAEG